MRIVTLLSAVCGLAILSSCEALCIEPMRPAGPTHSSLTMPQRSGKQHIYRGSHLSAIDFPLGGLGAGNIFVDGKGRWHRWHLWDYEEPASTPRLFFAARVKTGNRRHVVRAIQTVSEGSFEGMRDMEFRGEYPFGWFDYSDPALPVKLCVEVYTPLIPMNVRDSGIPCAICAITVENTSTSKAQVSVLAACQNALGCLNGSTGMLLNEVARIHGKTAVHMTTDLPPSSEYYGDIVLLCDATSPTAVAAYSDLAGLARDFSDDGKLEGSDKATRPSTGNNLHAAIAAPMLLGPGEKRTVRFAICWSFPNTRHGWGKASAEKFWTNRASEDWSRTAVGWQYTKWWPDALSCAGELARRLPYLESKTRLFHDTMYSSNLPRWLLDGLTSQIAVLRSPTVFWCRDGYFGAEEGWRDWAGDAKEGNCNHVYQYAQLPSYVFPEIARNMRESSFSLQHPNGMLSHRQTGNYHGPIPALDGQCGEILGVYREYLMSRDRRWLDLMWPSVKKAMEYCFTWDGKMLDGLFEQPQWSGMDDWAYGCTTWMGSMYLAALSATSRMARIEGDSELAVKCEDILRKGSDNQDRLLFNGDYYVQKTDETAGNLYLDGCHSEQLIGQWWANQLGLGLLYPRDHVLSTVNSIFKFNFFKSFNGVPRERIYASDSDAGMQLITWPRGGKPKATLFHHDQSWAGSEYASAALMIQTGMLDKGLTVAKAVRDRYDGRLRSEWTFAPGGNPFSEIEWGNFYSRSMSIWSVLLACQGFICDGPNGIIGFKPQWKAANHSSFFSCPDGWGLFSQERTALKQTDSIALKYGRISLIELVLELPADKTAKSVGVFLDGRKIATKFKIDGNELRVLLPGNTKISGGQTLGVKVHLR